MAIVTLALSRMRGRSDRRGALIHRHRGLRGLLTRLCGAIRAGAAAIPLAIHSTIGPRTVAPGGVQVRYDISIQRGRAMISAKTAAPAAVRRERHDERRLPLPGRGGRELFASRQTRGAERAVGQHRPETRIGTYQIAVTACGRLKPGGAMRSASTCVTLDVVRPPSFEIAGTTPASLPRACGERIELRSGTSRGSGCW